MQHSLDHLSEVFRPKQMMFPAPTAFEVSKKDDHPFSFDRVEDFSPRGLQEDDESSDEGFRRIHVVSSASSTEAEPYGKKSFDEESAAIDDSWTRRLFLFSEEKVGMRDDEILAALSDLAEAPPAKVTPTKRRRTTFIFPPKQKQEEETTVLLNSTPTDFFPADQRRRLLVTYPPRVVFAPQRREETAEELFEEVVNERATLESLRTQGDRGPDHVGAYAPEARKARVALFLHKRGKRTWSKKVKYDVRKNFADSRMRVKGRFVKKEDEDYLKELINIVV